MMSSTFKATTGQKALFIAAILVVVGVLAGCSDGRDDNVPEQQPNINASGNESDAPGQVTTNLPPGNTNTSYAGFEIRDTELVYAYRTDSPYADVLQSCVLVTLTEDSCQLTKLPFIGDGTTTPTIEQIMNRVLVTHDWMGVRFEQVLRTAPDTLLNMFSSTTAVLMGSNVRPSFYTRLNGAIQIDPNFLWTTLPEKNSISKAEDFRSSFGDDLQFMFWSRLAGPDGSRLAPFYSLNDDSERPVADIQIPLLRLLFHELSHATDFMPRDQISSLDNELSVLDAIDGIREFWLSNNLRVTYPLGSETLYDFAQVRYRGEEPNTEQQATTAATMGDLMAADGAIQFYSYTSQYEDLAQLVEGAMMAFHYGSITNVGFTPRPAEENFDCGDLLVAWGQRNRLSDALVNVRSRHATNLVVSTTPAMQAFFDNELNAAEAMDFNINWCDNQRPTSFVAADIQARSSEAAEPLTSGPQFREMLRADSIVHPESPQYD